MVSQQNGYTQDQKPAGAPRYTCFRQSIPFGQASRAKLCEVGRNLWRSVPSKTRKQGKFPILSWYGAVEEGAVASKCEHEIVEGSAARDKPVRESVCKIL